MGGNTSKCTARRASALQRIISNGCGYGNGMSFSAGLCSPSDGSGVSVPASNCTSPLPINVPHARRYRRRVRSKFLSAAAQKVGRAGCRSVISIFWEARGQWLRLMRRVLIQLKIQNYPWAAVGVTCNGMRQLPMLEETLAEMTASAPGLSACAQLLFRRFSSIW